MPSRLIPWVFAAGMTIVIAVNGVLVYFALGTWSGLVVARPYERGVQYNRVLETAMYQEALGWKFDIALVTESDATRIVVQAWDSAGEPLRDLNLHATVERPVEKEGHVAELFREQQPGRYVATIERLRPGQWQTHVVAERGADSASTAQRRFIR